MARFTPQVVSLCCAAAIAWTQAIPSAIASEPAPEEAIEDSLDEPAPKPAPKPAPEPEPAVDDGLAPLPEPAPRGEVSARLALIPLEIDGTVDEGADERLLTNLTKGFARGSFGIADQSSVGTIAGESCGDDCVKRLKSDESADYVVKTRIKVDDRDYIVEIDLLATEDADVVASTRERCDLCGLAEVGQLLEAQAAVLRRKLEDLVKGPPVIVIDTTPSGALVFIDNQLVGTSPLERPMIEGEHIVRVMLDGYVADEREVNLVSGVRETLELPLKRTPETAKYRAIGWASLGLGVPTFGAGVALLALDGRYSGPCDGLITIYDENGDRVTGTNPDYEPITCENVNNTRWGGAAALVGGAALVTAGVLLLLRTRNRNRSKGAAKNKKKSRARLVPTGFGVAGRF